MKNLNFRKIKHGLLTLLFLFSFLTMSLPGNSQIITGMIIGEAKDAANELIQSAFDRFDLTALKTAMEVRGLIEEAEYALKDVISHSVDELDGQQKRTINDLQNFKRLVSQDIEKALLEIREEKNSAISDLRLLLSNKPGAIRIIPSYALSQDQYIEFEIIGTALSKATFENTKLNGISISFDIDNQGDTKKIIRVPINNTIVSEQIRRNGGKPAEAKISFDIIERSWFKLFETGRRRFSSTGFILPKIIGSARAVYSGDWIEKVTKNIKEKPFEVRTNQARYTLTSGRVRGRKESGITLEPDPGWTIDTRTAKIEFKKSKGCSNAQSYAEFAAKKSSGLVLKVLAVSHLSNGSVCKTSTIVRFTQMRDNVKKNKTITTNLQQIRTNSDVTFNLPANSNLKRSRLLHLKVSSPLFGNGSKILYPNDRLGILKLDYHPTTQTAILRTGI